MRPIRIALREDERNALDQLAQAERRDLRAQAALLIVESLRARGLLPLVNATPTDAAQRQEVCNAIAG